MYNNKTNLSVSLAGWAVGLKETTASGWSVLWIMISAILIWRKKLCSPCRTPSGQKCNLCLRNLLLPMSPERTIENMVARDGVEPPTPAFSGATETVLAVTYKDVEGCEIPVRTRKDKG